VNALTGAGQPFGEDGGAPVEHVMTEEEYDERYEAIRTKYHLNR